MIKSHGTFLYFFSFGLYIKQVGITLLFLEGPAAITGENHCSRYNLPLQQLKASLEIHYKDQRERQTTKKLELLDQRRRDKKRCMQN